VDIWWMIIVITNEWSLLTALSEHLIRECEVAFSI